jgi:hypothetical protein
MQLNSIFSLEYVLAAQVKIMLEKEYGIVEYLSIEYIDNVSI